MEFFSQSRDRIEVKIDGFLKSKKQDFRQVNPWGLDAIERLSPFLKSGKMIRGGLVCLGYRLTEQRMKSSVIQTAAAVEFIQAGLLIHDDIIDRDKYRRGHPSMYFQFVQTGKKSRVDDPMHFGQGMGICVGDIGFFLAFELLSGIKASPKAKETISDLWAKELSYVGIAQMQDLYSGLIPRPAPEKEILRLYRYKTARYSFSLPLMTGCILGGGRLQLLKQLEKCGQYFGLLFQLKDDELGILGSEAELGKPVGSDIKECKKTLYFYHLFQKANQREKARLRKIYGNTKLTRSMVKEVQDLLKKYGIQDLVNKKITRLGRNTKKAIAELNVRESYRNILCDLLEYSITRQK